MEQKGFTIIELIISIFLMLFAVVGIFGAFSIVTILTSNSADRLAATYLAQEGMEIVRNIRDNNWLAMDACLSNSDCEIQNNAWVEGLTNPGACTNESQGCKADYQPMDTLVPYGNNEENYLRININNGGFYDYDNSGVKTKFQRKIVITPLSDVNSQSDDHIIKVTVKVSWDEKATIAGPGVLANNCEEGKNCVVSEETLYNWYNYVHQ